jgi:hypothetical protein
MSKPTRMCFSDRLNHSVDCGHCRRRDPHLPRAIPITSRRKKLLIPTDTLLILNPDTRIPTIRIFVYIPTDFLRSNPVLLIWLIPLQPQHFIPVVWIRYPSIGKQLFGQVLQRVSFLRLICTKTKNHCTKHRRESRPREQSNL